MTYSLSSFGLSKCIIQFSLILIHYYLQFKMQKLQSDGQMGKRNLQSIQFFDYYINVLFPSLFETQNYPPRSSARYRTTERNISYNYLYQSNLGVENVNKNAILEAAKFTYFVGEGAKLKQNTFLKKSIVKLPLLLISREIQEKIDLIIMKQDKVTIKHRSSISTSTSENGTHRLKKEDLSSSLSSRRASKLINNEGESFSLFVLHYSHNEGSNSQACWQNFIEKYNFSSKVEKDGKVKPVITYEAVFSFHSESSLLRLDQTQKILQKFFESSVLSEKQAKLPMLQKFHNRLRNLIQKNQLAKNLESQSPSFDQIHRRELQLTEQQLNIFNSLKPKAYAYYSTANKKKQANRYFLQNLVCRMMKNENYKEKESWQAIKRYIEFQKKLRSKYTWTHFQRYHKMNIFSYIGKDPMGRPVLIDRLRNNLCSQIQDFDDFFHYLMYLFEIYMQDQMEGWVDQFSVIADVSNQVSDNTNLTFTKRLIMEGFQYIMGRPYKIIAFDIGYIGIFVHRVLGPLLPSSFKECFKIIGDDRVELLEELRTFLDDEVIPQFLGGKNPTLETLKEQNKFNSE